MMQEFHAHNTYNIYALVTPKDLTFWQAIKCRLMGRRAVLKFLAKEVEDQIKDFMPEIEKKMAEQAERFLDTHIIH